MKYEVRITNEALNDLYATYRYVAVNDSPGKAEHLLDNIHKAMTSLETMPACDNYPPEMHRWGIPDFKEIFFKPYRIIYEIKGKSVFIHAVFDGRRNCEDLLQQRLLGML
ncbi:MAG TPA: type II toxin-antitoxin system RelE/ParE family toxin [Nitrospirae bacterium]|nr:plasmid stabilization system protein [bacterium BMS3Abin06]HDH12386.1 type II toxin-antitoxin system RelE/ParE family toxin [Nitrospirota bacterium]HDZ01268.1 type II toxin-antitoxin system RelE/ParE family toxin [Nitrospirota bacterium]